MERPCMNPASMIWPVCCPDPFQTVTAQKKRYRTEGNIVILNADWQVDPRYKKEEDNA